MALTVEDGTGLSSADAYVSVADATTYHANLGNTAWASAAESAQEIALRRAAQYIDARFRYRGWRLTTTQALEWPRSYYEPDGRTESWIPKNLKEAVCEAALRALSDTLYEDVSTDRVTEETVGPITVKYAGKGGQTRMPVVDALLARYAIGGGGIRLERAA